MAADTDVESSDLKHSRLDFPSAGCLFPCLAFLLIAGGFSLGAIPENFDRRFETEIYALMGFLMLSGIVIAFAGRRLVILDRARGEVIVALRLFRVFPRETRPFRDFERVVLLSGSSMSGGRMHTSHTVYLQGPGKWIEIHGGHDRDRASREAFEVAEFMGLPVSKQRVVGRAIQTKELAPGEFSGPLRRRLKESGDLPAAPAELRIRWELTPDGFRGEIPPRGMQRTHRSLLRYLWASLPMPILIVAFWAREFFRRSRTMDAEQVAWLAGGAVPALIIGILIGEVRFLARRQREWILASPRGVTVQWDGFLGGTRRVFLAADQLRELEVESRDVERGGFAVWPGPCLCARTNRRHFRFAGGLGREEVIWLREMVLRALKTS